MCVRICVLGGGGIIFQGPAVIICEHSRRFLVRSEEGPTIALPLPFLIFFAFVKNPELPFESVCLDLPKIY